MCRFSYRLSIGETSPRRRFVYATSQSSAGGRRDQGFRRFRYSTGDAINAATASTELGREGVGGWLITASDLGLTTGTQIYGYALMAADVTATNSTQLMDWTGPTCYPTTTDATTCGGGIDLAAKACAIS